MFEIGPEFLISVQTGYFSRFPEPCSRPQNIPLYGCQSIRMGSSSGTDESILSWSLVGRPIPVPYQHVGNNGHSSPTDKSLKIYSPSLCHDFYRYHNSGLIYQQTRWNTFSQFVRRGMEDPPMVPKTSYCHQDSSYPRQIDCFGRQVIENRQNSQNRMGIGSIDSEFNFPNFNYPSLDLFATRFNHKLPLYVSPVLDNQAFAIDAFSMNWNNLHAYAFPPTILIPSVLNKICQSQCRIVLIAPLWPQQTWF